MKVESVNLPEGEETGGDTRFWALRAKKEWTDHWDGRSIQCERKLVLSQFKGAPYELYENFRKRGWKKFAEFNANACVTLCRELFANLVYKERGEYIAEVRKKEFSLSVEVIGEVLGLKRCKNPEYPFPDDKKPSRDTMAKELTRDGGAWGPAKLLDKKRLNHKYLTLHIFSCYSIFPLARVGQVSADRAELIYAIGTGATMDMREVIWRYIHLAKKNHKGRDAIPFGGLLTELIRRNGIPFPANSETRRPIKAIDAETINRSVGQRKRKDIGNGESASAPAHQDLRQEILRKLNQIQTEQYAQRLLMAGLYSHFRIPMPDHLPYPYPYQPFPPFEQQPSSQKNPPSSEDQLPPSSQENTPPSEDQLPPE